MHIKVDKLQSKVNRSHYENIASESNYQQKYAESSQQALCWARETQSVIENVAYGHQEAEKLDLYLPHRDIESTNKLFVYLHLGYWQLFDKSNASFAATNFQQHGNYFAVLDYPLSDELGLLSVVEQNRRAVAFLYENAAVFGYDKNQIMLIGSAGGAHLATMVCATNWPAWRVKNKYKSRFPKNLISGVVAMNGIYDMSQPVPQNICSRRIDSNYVTAALSPINLKLKNICSFILVYSAGGSPANKIQTITYAKYLDEQNIPYQIREIVGRNQYDVVFELAQKDSEIFALCLQL